MIGYETAVPLVADPFGGSYYVESLTDKVEEEALAIMAEMDEGGGAVACIESGWTQRRIAESAYRFQKRIESGERVDRRRGTASAASDADAVEIMRISPRHQVAQARALKRLRAQRFLVCSNATERRSSGPRAGPTNLMPVLKAALADYVTIGECCAVLRGVFGEYRPREAA